MPTEESDTQSDGIPTDESDTQSDGTPYSESDIHSDGNPTSESDSQSEDMKSVDIKVESNNSAKLNDGNIVFNNCVQYPADEIQVLEECEIKTSSDSRGY